MPSAMLHLTFLGTSAGIPTTQRNVSALAVQAPLARAGWILIDCGEGTQQQLLRTRLSPHDLACICISHVHGDHCYGLPGLIATMGMMRRQHPLRLIAPAPLWQWLQAALALTDLYVPFEIAFTDVGTLTERTLALDTASPDVQLHIGTHALEHRVPSHAFRVDLRHTQRHLDADALHAAGLPQGPAWRALQDGRDVQHDGRTFASGDFVHTRTRALAAVMGGDNARPELLRAACAGVPGQIPPASLLVHEATYSHATLQKVGPAPMHSSARQVAEFAQAAGVPNLILNHFSPRHHSDAEQALLLQEVQTHYRGHAALARDFDAFTLDFEGCLQRL